MASGRRREPPQAPPLPVSTPWRGGQWGRGGGSDADHLFVIDVKRNATCDASEVSDYNDYHVLNHTDTDNSGVFFQ